MFTRSDTDVVLGSVCVRHLITGVDTGIDTDLYAIVVFGCVRLCVRHVQTVRPKGEVLLLPRVFRQPPERSVLYVHVTLA